MNKFTHLNLHSEYSIQDGLVRINDLANKASELNFESLAITDISNLFGFIKFYKELRKKGIKPICGSDFSLMGENSNSGNLQLLVKNHNGYKNLIRLISKAHTSGKVNGNPYLSIQDLEVFSEDLLLITGGIDSQIGQSILAGKLDIALKQVKYLRNIYKENFFLQLTRTGKNQEELCNQALIEFSNELGIPVVATNQVRFLGKEDFEAHETRVCIQSGHVLGDQRRQRFYEDSQYFKSTKEMNELFSDIPEALSNSYEISKKCNLEIETGIYVLPDFDTPTEASEANYLKDLIQKGITKKLGLDNPSQISDIYKERLDYELEVILEMGYEGYFLIVADFVNWAKQNSVPVGPGRGSGAGSLIAYAIGITGIDPIKYDLLFERFLNPDRISNPDFDIDFCRDGREKVIEYVTEKYGKDAVAQICTFGTMAARAVVRDVARAQGKSYGLADRLAKMIPFSPEMTLEKALKDNADLRRTLKTDEDASEIFDMAKKLEGVIRNVGKHAAGVVMAPSEINDYSPLYLDETTNTLATQFDMKDIESVGLQKFDFLGLKTLTGNK
jgi:DNA polymerase-3 subunit alpha